MKRACFCRMVCVLGLLAMLLTSCGAGESDPLSYRTGDRRATLSGSYRGMELCCEVLCRDGEPQSIRYSKPEALAGVTAEPLGERCRLTKGKTVYELSAAAAEGLLMPARLLMLPNATLRAAQKLPTGSLLQFTCPTQGEVELTLSEQGLPQFIATKEASFAVTWG